MEKYIAMAKSAKDFSENADIQLFPNVAKAHINGLADMVLRLCCEIDRNIINEEHKKLNFDGKFDSGVLSNE